MNSHLVDCTQRCILVIALFLLTFTQAMAQSGPGCQETGIDGVFADSFEADPFCPEPCLVNEQIQAVRDSVDGLVSLPIEHVYVTYIRPTIGNDLTGFFLQGRYRTGPAIYADIDPAGLVPPLEVGDVISLMVTEVGSLNGGLRSIVSISGLLVEAKEQFITSFIPDVSLNTDLVSELDAYESEIISLNGAIGGAFRPAGSGFEAAILSTPGIIGHPDLRLRIPAELREEISLDHGCGIKLCGTPMWRYNHIAQPSVWHANNISVVDCPAPKVVAAAAVGADRVKINFDRQIDVSSVTGDGSQFVFDNGLIATAAVATGDYVEVSTSAQVSEQVYQVVVADTVNDTFGSGVDANMNSAEFIGFRTPAVLRVNEFNANIADGCDLVELRVIASGTMDGIYLKERTSIELMFTDFPVNTDELIVVHFAAGNSNCNGTGATNETVSTNELPNAVHSQNYDTAYDWYSPGTGITATDNVLTLYYPTGFIMDAVLASDDVTGTSAVASETQAAEAAANGHWQMVGGGVPAGGFVDDDFSAHAAQDLNGTGTSASGESIQRGNDADNNDKLDWIMAAPSWGALNSGQTH